MSTLVAVGLLAAGVGGAALADRQSRSGPAARFIAADLTKAPGVGAATSNRVQNYDELLDNVCAEAGLTADQCATLKAAARGDTALALEQLRKMLLDAAHKGCAEYFDEEKAGDVCEAIAEWTIGKAVELYKLFRPERFRPPWHRDGDRSQMRKVNGAPSDLRPGELLVLAYKLPPYTRDQIAAVVGTGWRGVAIKAEVHTADGLRIPVPVRRAFTVGAQPRKYAKTSKGRVLYRILDEGWPARDRAGRLTTSANWYRLASERGIPFAADEGIPFDITETNFKRLVTSKALVLVGRQTGY